ncbi:enoyl-CoA hydratase/isomerase family protein [Nonomuraea ferruginea]|uniref:Enoyl-CoA hydratase/isomerase family protein n=1 Tax=Nonomuraea ferruginea TaxID=46174 RepID=A0ABT4TDC2_9ACTN|nr:enoyl-CoA hydratase/isomerase family protein [Nonomuraea ferruginea]MDA0647514.1 enoyl-CoA hydratase/isomerase family protein [Nonomuraea ferruginea]
MIVVSEPRPRVRLVTLDRPARRNALDLAGFRDLAAAWREVAASGAGVVVVTGGSDFSSGADLATFSADVAAAIRGGRSSAGASAPDAGGPAAAVWADVHHALLRDVVLEVPVVAAIEGICFGAGMELAGATDIRIAGESALFSLPEVRHGFIASGGSVARLPRQIGYPAAMQVMLTGERFGAERMRAWGFVGEVVPDGAALGRALDLAELIAGHPAAAVRGIKRAVGEGVRGTLADAYAVESRVSDEVLGG